MLYKYNAFRINNKITFIKISDKINLNKSNKLKQTCYRAMYKNYSVNRS